MTALDVFLHLTAAGCQLTRQGDALRVHDPQHVLTDALRQADSHPQSRTAGHAHPERRHPPPALPRAVLAVQGTE